MARQVFTKLITPIGSAVWPKLITPDTKFKAGGEYTCKLALEPDAASDMIALLEKALDNYIENFKADPDNSSKIRKFYEKDGVTPVRRAAVYTEEYDADDKATGRLIFNFKRPASYLDKKTDNQRPMRPPTLFDSQGTIIKGLEDLWGGSRLSIAGHIRPYAMESTQQFGLSLRVDAVQVIELSDGILKTADSFGFGKQEGGFEASDSPFVSPEAEAVGPEEDDGADDF